MSGPEVQLDPTRAAERLADWGFLATPDLPDRPGPARLLVAVRPVPTLRHYDPEVIEYWVTQGGHGVLRALTGDSRTPIRSAFSWGPIRLTDRLSITNDYRSFGGRLETDRVDDALVAVFTSPAPILRRGGHSQGWDPGADGMGAFFARLRVPVAAVPGVEATVADADPLVRYAAFVADSVARFRRATDTRLTDPGLWVLLRAEERRLRRVEPEAWGGGLALLDVLSSGSIRAARHGPA